MEKGTDAVTSRAGAERKSPEAAQEESVPEGQLSQSFDYGSDEQAESSQHESVKEAESESDSGYDDDFAEQELESYGSSTGDEGAECQSQDDVADKDVVVDKVTDGSNYDVKGVDKASEAAREAMRTGFTSTSENATSGSQNMPIAHEAQEAFRVPTMALTNSAMENSAQQRPHTAEECGLNVTRDILHKVTSISATLSDNSQREDLDTRGTAVSSHVEDGEGILETSVAQATQSPLLQDARVEHKRRIVDAGQAPAAAHEIPTSILGSETFAGLSPSTRPRVLLTGASGLLGRQVFLHLDPERFEVRGLYASRIAEHLVHADLLKEGEIEKQFTDFKPHVAIHTVAERRPAVVMKNPEDSMALNVGVTQGIAEACSKHSVWLIFVSTDYVFDGENPPYQVDAKPNPLGEYGQQKLQAERECIGKCSCAVLRVPLLFGPMEYMRESGVTTMYEELKDGLKSADHTQTRYPTYTVDVAQIILRMVECRLFANKELTGVFHWQNDEGATKYDMVKLIADIVDMDASNVQPKLTRPKFPGPRDSRLDCSRLIEELNIDPANYRTLFKDALQSVFKSFSSNLWDSKVLPGRLSTDVSLRSEVDSKVLPGRLSTDVSLRSEVVDKSIPSVEDTAVAPVAHDVVNDLVEGATFAHVYSENHCDQLSLASELLSEGWQSPFSNRVRTPLESSVRPRPDDRWPEKSLESSVHPRPDDHWLMQVPPDAPLEDGEKASVEADAWHTRLPPRVPVEEDEESEAPDENWDQLGEDMLVAPAESAIACTANVKKAPAESTITQTAKGKPYGVNSSAVRDMLTSHSDVYNGFIHYPGLDELLSDPSFQVREEWRRKIYPPQQTQPEIDAPLMWQSGAHNPPYGHRRPDGLRQPAHSPRTGRRVRPHLASAINAADVHISLIGTRTVRSTKLGILEVPIRHAQSPPMQFSSRSRSPSPPPVSSKIPLSKTCLSNRAMAFARCYLPPEPPRSARRNGFRRGLAQSGQAAEKFATKSLPPLPGTATLCTALLPQAAR
jgi:dTDP-4-dehydrorhamnose reductase